MFRHKENLQNEAKDRENDKSPADLPTEIEKKQPETAKTEPADLRELIEKNLKWSQIIYEQNRKINNKLLWAAVFGWFKLIIIVVPIVLAIIYLQPVAKSVWTQYNELLGGIPATKGVLKQGSLDSLLQLFNLDPAKQEQLKALLK